jgi:hypothetical protein
MKYKLELTITKPRLEVWNAFIDPDKKKSWQPSLIRVEPVSGTDGQPETVKKLTFRENEREFSLLEKTIYREEPGSLHQLYENKFADNTIRNTFIEQGKDQTLWVQETEYKFKTLIMRVLGPVLKKNFIARTNQEMQRFKDMMESQ